MMLKAESSKLNAKGNKPIPRYYSAAIMIYTCLFYEGIKPIIAARLTFDCSGGVYPRRQWTV
jgi:hypothetical protein